MLFIQAFFAILFNKDTRPLVYAFLAVISTGTLVYHFVEGRKWIDSLYFSVITLATVGYGDFHPVTNFGKLFTIVYIIIGIGLFVTFVDVYFLHVRKIGKSGIEKIRNKEQTKE